ncbi:MAG: SIMPL domain-containing protein [Verrucomicrobiales bacterium]|nr:SIMPL domain-containing protein [Verrucomicrobiales bacterium]
MKITTLLAASLILPSLTLAQNTPTPPLVSVTGEAEIRVAPDIVLITLGVEVREPKLDAATERHSTQISGLIDFVKSIGIDEKNIQTDYINIRLNYNPSVSRTQPDHYQVTKNLTVRLTDITRFEPLLAGALKNGANNVHNVQFLTSELRKHRDAARANAIKAAKQKAVDLTTALGQSVGRVYKIQEHGGGHAYSRSALMTQNSIQSFSAGTAGGEFAAGQIAITANVSVSFVIQ